MKKRHIAVNIITAILAVMLSALLVVSVTTTALYSVVLNTVTPDSLSRMVTTTVTDFVESPDFEEMILENDTVQENIEHWGITTEAVGDLLQSDAAQEVIDLLAADFSNLLTGVDETNLTPDVLLNIVKEHADDLADIAVQYADEPVDKEEVKNLIISTVEENKEDLTASFPSVESIRAEVITDNSAIEMVLSFLNPLYLWAALGLCLVLALLVYLCRCYRFGGFMWLGVDGLLSTTLIGGGVIAMQRLLATLLTDKIGALRGVIGSMAGHFSQQMILRMWICLAVSIALICLYVLLYLLVVRRKKKAAKLAAAVVAAPAVEPIPVAEETAPAMETPAPTAEEAIPAVAEEPSAAVTEE